MSIVSIDGALAGMQYPCEFVKALTGTMVAGRPHSAFQLAGIPGAGIYPANVAVTSSSVANPTLITTGAVHGLASGDKVSIQGHTGSTPALDGVYIATYVGTSTFTIPVNVTVGGTGGVTCTIDKGGSGLAGNTGKVLTTLAGQIPFSNPVSGNTYLARLQAMATQAGSLLLCDMLQYFSGISPVKTTEQTFTDALTIPARDANGLAIGHQIYAGVEVSSLMGAGTPTITIKYTNQDNVANKTGTNQVAVVAASIAGTFYPIGLSAGDTGIQKAQSITLSATMTSGQINVVLYRVLARLELTGANIPNAIDALTGGFVRLYDNTVPFLVFIPNATTTSNIVGHVIWTSG